MKLLFAAALVLGISTLSNAHAALAPIEHPAREASLRNDGAASNPASKIQLAIQEFNRAYASHRSQITGAANAAQRIRHDPMIGTIALLFFLVISAPAKVTDLKKYYDAMTSNKPIPWFRRFGINGDDLTNTRRVLFFYTLFLIYQVISYPLMRWNDSSVAFYSDLIFQVLIVILLFRAYAKLRREIFEKWPDDPYNRAHVRKWFAQNIDDMRLRFSDMRRLAVLGFFGSFLPAIIANIPRVLDQAVLVDQKLAVLL